METNDNPTPKSDARIDPPEITETAEQRAAVIHLEVRRNQMKEAFASAVHELMGVLEDRGIEPLGPVFAHHLEIDPQVFDFEVGFPVAEVIAEEGRVKPGRLPATTVARTVYQGPYDGMADAWAQFSAWIEENGHAPGPNAWERYLVGPDSDPDPSAWRTELNRPLVE